ncbi:hypothetical protein DFH09DRAFT_1341413 [Mycena vulgaris]|nr:hypothetical protein DFH09DRAFT_1341413 [Mycena vulgaris]
MRLRSHRVRSHPRPRRSIPRAACLQTPPHPCIPRGTSPSSLPSTPRIPPRLHTLCPLPPPVHFASRAAPPPLKPTSAHIRRAHPPAPHVRCASFLAPRRLPRSRPSRKRQRQRPQHQRRTQRPEHLALDPHAKRGWHRVRSHNVEVEVLAGKILTAEHAGRGRVQVCLARTASRASPGGAATARAAYVRPPGLEGGASASGDGREGRAALHVLRIAVARPMYEAGAGGGRVGRAVGGVLARASRSGDRGEEEGEGLVLHILFGAPGRRGARIAEYCYHGWDVDGAPGLALLEVRSTVRAVELYKVMHAVLPRFPAPHTLLLTRPPALYPPRPTEPPSPSLFFLSLPATPGFPPPPTVPHARTLGQALLSLRVPPSPSFCGSPSEDVAAWLRWAVSPHATLMLMLTLPVPLALQLSLHWFQVNSLSTPLVGLLLLPHMMRTAREHSTVPRIVVVSSDLHYFISIPQSICEGGNILVNATLGSADYCTPAKMQTQYMVTKLLNVLFIRALNARLGASPLIVSTMFFSSIVKRIFALTTEEGSRQLVWGAVGLPQSPNKLRGEYISQSTVEEPSDFVISAEGGKAQDQIWDELVEMLGKVDPRVFSAVATHLSPPV